MKSGKGNQALKFRIPYFYQKANVTSTGTLTVSAKIELEQITVIHHIQKQHLPEAYVVDVTFEDKEPVGTRMQKIINLGPLENYRTTARPFNIAHKKAFTWIAEQ